MCGRHQGLDSQRVLSRWRATHSLLPVRLLSPGEQVANGARPTVFPAPLLSSGAHLTNSIVPSNVPVRPPKKPLTGGLDSDATPMSFQVWTIVPVAPAKRPVPPLTSNVNCPLATRVSGSKHAGWPPGLRFKKSCSPLLVKLSTKTSPTNVSSTPLPPPGGRHLLPSG